MCISCVPQDFDEFKEWYQGREAREEAKKKAAEEAAAEAEANKLKKLGSVTRPKERTGEVNVDDPAFEEKLQQIFDRYDDDGSGEIDAVRSPSPRQFGRSGRWILKCGAVGLLFTARCLRQEELGQIFEALGQPMAPDELTALVEEIDADGSGMIEFDEFLQMVKSTGGGAAAVLRDQAFGEMDAEEKHMWARGKILRFPQGTFQDSMSGKTHMMLSCKKCRRR